MNGEGGGDSLSRHRITRGNYEIASLIANSKSLGVKPLEMNEVYGYYNNPQSNEKLPFEHVQGHQR